MLKPKYDSGEYKLVAKQAIEKWDNQIGGTTFEQLLTANGGKVDGVHAANDGLAGAIITVLTKYGLNGKVIVTGQDATPDGLQAILRGDQYMTVYKPIKQEADAAAKLAAALAKGDTAAADALATATEKDPTGNRDVKSVLLEPQLITKENVKTVIDDGAVPAERGLRGRPGRRLRPARHPVTHTPRECVAVLRARLRTHGHRRCALHGDPAAAQGEQELRRRPGAARRGLHGARR